MLLGVSVLAVQKHGPTRGICDDAQETHDILVLGVPGFHVDVFVAQRQIPKLIPVRVQRTQVDYRPHTQAGQLSHALRRRLGAAQQCVAHAV